MRRHHAPMAEMHWLANHRSFTAKAIMRVRALRRFIGRPMLRQRVSSHFFPFPSGDSLLLLLSPTLFSSFVVAAVAENEENLLAPIISCVIREIFETIPREHNSFRVI